MRNIKVDAGAPYEVMLGRGLLEGAGEHIRACVGVCHAMLVSDGTVFSLYGECVKASLEGAGFEVDCFVFEQGESSKNTATLVSLIEYMAEKQLTRRDIAVALGGGVVGDMTGFAAAIYQRGINYIQIPTTLLAMVDSSVGGKTAVDLKAGKNLAGAFWQPSLVICDIDALKTLSGEIFADGCAEVIKYGVISDSELFALLERELAPDSSELENIIARCIEIKADVVSRDEREGGLRQILNFGHTAAHGIEKLSAYAISHGSAVAIGMVIAARAAENKGVCEKGTADRIEALCKKCGLPVRSDYTSEQLASIALSDKKRSGGKLTFVFPTGIGACKRVEIDISEIKEVFEKGM